MAGVDNHGRRANDTHVNDNALDVASEVGGKRTGHGAFLGELLLDSRRQRALKTHAHRPAAINATAGNALDNT
jgi:hypothetical protein